MTPGRLLSAVTLLSMLAGSAAAACPEEAPSGAATLEFQGCGADCLAGANVSIRYQPLAPPILPHPGVRPYEIQPCDQLSWNFGDGSPQTIRTGVGSVSHSWTAPGNYTVRLTIANSLGSMTLDRPVVIGPVSVISLNAATGHEGNASMTVPFQRTGDTTRRVSARFRVRPSGNFLASAIGSHDINVVFEPGETAKSITLPLADNHFYDGPRNVFASLDAPSGGARFPEGLSSSGTIRIEDDEPRPALSFDEEWTIAEGDSGDSVLMIPVRLSGAVGHSYILGAEVVGGSASYSSDYDVQFDARFVAGSDSGAVRFRILNDIVPEPTEDVLLRIGDAPRPARVTIFDNDETVRPRVASGNVGERVMLTYHTQPSPATRTVPLRSSNPAVARVAATLTIPANEYSIPIKVSLLAEGDAAITVADAFTAMVTVRQPRAVTVSESSLRIVSGGTKTFSLTLAPPHSGPVVVRLIADERIASVPETVTVPPGAAVDVPVRGVSAGQCTIAVSAPGEAITGAAIGVEVTPAQKRRALR